jgi:hypothetical protein
MLYMCVHARIRGTMKTLVLVDEEYGYRYHLLLTDLTLDQFTQWWASQGHIDDRDLTFLPGYLCEMETEEQNTLWQFYKACLSLPHIHVHTDGDSMLTLPDGTKVKHMGYDEHFYDSKPGDRVAWFDTSTNPPTWHYGHYDYKLEIVEDPPDNTFWVL